jgi:hypothetical protein
VHRSAGIQGDRKHGKRFAGRIQLPEEQARFTMTLKKIDSGLLRSYCEEAKPAGTTGRGLAYHDDLEFWFFCKASYEIELSHSKLTPAMRGDNRNVFMDRGPFNIFHLFSDSSFAFFSTDVGGNWYIEEGECQHM